MHTFFILFLALLSFFTQDTGHIEPQAIIDKCIHVHGGKQVSNAHFKFDFRKYRYTYKREEGTYQYSRAHKETGIKDILSNDGIVRTDQGKKVDLNAKQKRSYSNSVNSVIYFAFLPYFLNDDAVNKKFLGTEKIKDKDYYKIEVTFDQEGGGDDHDDIYVYWINKENFTLDYLAYSFHVNGGGVRFRSAYNSRIIEGVTFQDYVNLKHDKTTPVEDLGLLYDQDKLIELSKIELVNIISIEN